MQKKILAFILVTVQMLSLAFAVQAEETPEEIILHVATTGKGNGDGSENNPFPSIEKARDYLRKNDHKNKTVRVKIHKGRYYQSDVLSFDSSDSGSKDNPVIYESAGDGEVTLKGSIEVDFTQFKPITNPEIVKRLSPGMQKYVGVIDLKKFGFTSEMVDFISNTQKTVYEYPNILGIYLNGQKQPLAKYPNSGWLKVLRLVEAGGRYPNYSQSAIGDVIEIPNLPNLERWVEAPDIQIQGYLSAEYSKDWRQIKSIDIDKRELTFLKYSMAAPMKNGRFQILNLLEEIDMPGEWYIDKRTCEMYYYPSHNLRFGIDSLSIATLNKNFVEFKGSSYITLKGLNFEENAANGIVFDKNCKNITISHCKLKNIGGTGVMVYGENILVTGCKFEATSKKAILLDGGDMATLTHANNEVSNCHFYNTGIEGGGNSDGAVQMLGCGNRFKYNTIHNIINYPISYYCCESEISNNEIFNSIRQTADAAVIYTGRSFLYQGNKIQYNFIHDTTMFDYSSGLGSHAIAFDDWSSGNEVSWNIIYMGKKTGTVTGMATGSRDSTTQYNTTICSTQGNKASYRDVPEVYTNTGFWRGGLDQLFANSQKFDTENAKWSSKYSSFSKITADIEKDNNMILPRNNKILGNLAVDCVTSESYYDEKILANTDLNNRIEGNVSIDDYDVFVDPDNRDFRIKMSAIEKYGISDKVLNEENWDMDRMGVQEDVLKLEIPDKPFYKIYPRNGTEGIQRNEALISWEQAEYADEYYYVVATDAELKNVVAEGRTMDTAVKMEGLENGKSYYWNVWAKNISRKYNNEWISGETPYLFSVATYDNLEKTALKTTVKEAKAEMELIEEATTPTVGGFKIGSKEKIKEVIDSAEAELKKSYNTQENLDNVDASLKEFMRGKDAFKYQGYENIEFASADDVKVENATCNVTYDNGVIKAFPATPGMDSHISLNRKINQSNSVARFRLKMSNINGYSCVSVRNTQTSLKTYATPAYTVVVKADLIELQKGAKVVATHPNDVKSGPITDGGWHEWEIVTADITGGVGIKVFIDGVQLIEYIDESEALHQEGTFVINTYKDMPFEVAAPTEKIEGFYDAENEFIKADDNIIRDESHKSLIKTGTFTESTVKGHDGKNISVSDGNVAEALWKETFDSGYYKVSYYHTPIENGDKNAKVIMESGGGISGNTSYSIPVDFSEGESGWIDMGTILIMGINGQVGDFKFYIKSEGGGIIPITAYKLETSTEEAKEITDAVYNKNSNVLILKPDSAKAYKNMNELDLARAATIENSRTLVPLRFVAESFNCDVSWVDGEKKAVIKKEDKTIEFVIGSNQYIVNGKMISLDQPAVIRDNYTMVPIRAISDALGKQCHWDEKRRLIFICDTFGVNSDDDMVFDNCAKLFR